MQLNIRKGISFFMTALKSEGWSMNGLFGTEYPIQTHVPYGFRVPSAAEASALCTAE